MATAFDDLLTEAQPNSAAGFDDLLTTEAPDTGAFDDLLADEPQPGRAESAWNTVKRGFMDVAEAPVKAAGNAQRAVDEMLGFKAPFILDMRTAGDVAADAQAISQEMRPVNPAFKVTNTIAGAIPTAMAMASSGALAGAPAALSLAGAMGADQGFETAKEIGVTSPAGRLATAAGFAIPEVVIEMMGGFGAKPVAVPLLKRAIVGGTIEAIEEPITGAAQAGITRLAATEDPSRPGFTRTGYDLGQLNPFDGRFIENRALELLGGATGGAIFAGVEALRGNPPAVLPPSSETDNAPVPSSVAPPLPQQQPPPLPVTAPTGEASFPMPALTIPPDFSTVQAPEGDILTDFSNASVTPAPATGVTIPPAETRQEAPVTPETDAGSTPATGGTVSAGVMGQAGVMEQGSDGPPPGRAPADPVQAEAVGVMGGRESQVPVQTEDSQNAPSSAPSTNAPAIPSPDDTAGSDRSGGGNAAGAGGPGAASATEYAPSKALKAFTAAYKALADEQPLIYRKSPEQELTLMAQAMLDNPEFGLEAATNELLTSTSADLGLTDREHSAMIGQAMLRWKDRAMAAQAQGRTDAVAETLMRATFDASRSRANMAGSGLQVWDYIRKQDPVAAVMELESDLEQSHAENVTQHMGMTPEEIEAEIQRRVKEELAKQRATMATGAGQGKGSIGATATQAEKQAAARVQAMAQRLTDTASEGTREPQPVARLVDEAIKSEAEPADVAARLQELGVTPATATKLEGLINETRRRAETAARDRAAARLVESLTPKGRTRKVRRNIPAVIDKFLQSQAMGMSGHRPFLKAWAQTFGLPEITPQMERDLRDMARKIRALPEGPMKAEALADLLDAIEDARAPGDGLMTSVWYANLLSGVSTQSINIFGNLSNLTLRSAALGLVNRPADMLRYLAGMKRGLKPAGRELSAAIRTGMAVKGRNKYSEVSRLERIYRKGGPQNWKEWAVVMGTLGPVGKYTGRLLTGADAAFSVLSREAYAGLAASKAARKTGKPRGSPEFEREFANQLGLGTQTWEKEMEAARQQLRDAGQPMTEAAIARQAWSNVVARRPVELTAKTERFGARATFQQDPEGLSGVIFNLVTKLQGAKAFEKVPVFRPFVPFAKFVANALDNSVDFTPLGAWRAVRGRHIFGGPNSTVFDADEQAERMGAAILGSALAAAAGSLAWQHKDEDDVQVPFMIYAMGPDDPERRKLMPPGWKPFSIKTGDNYWGYAETPLGPILAVAGAMLDAARYRKNYNEADAFEWAGYLAQASASVIMKQGVLSNLTGLVDAMKGQKPIKGTVGSITSGFIPGYGILRDITRVMDPTKISADTLAAAVFKDVPVVRNIVGKPDLNYWGEPVKHEGIPIINRVMSGRREDPLGDWIIRNRLTLPGYPQKVRLGDYLPARGKDAMNRKAAQLNAMHAMAFSPNMEHEWHRRSGELSRQAVNRFMKERPVVKADEMEGVQRALNASIEAARRVAMVEAAERTLR